jgi:hypothetical protein
MMNQHMLGQLVFASDDELMAVLGATALPLLNSPNEILQAGRNGEFWADGAAVQGEELVFIHEGFERAGRTFLKKWAAQLRLAVCHNGNLGQELRTEGAHQLDVGVALVTSSLAVAIPALAPFSGLLTVLAVMIARSGARAFCEMLDELDPVGPGAKTA